MARWERPLAHKISTTLTQVVNMNFLDTVKSNPWYLVLGIAAVGGIVLIMHNRGMF